MSKSSTKSDSKSDSKTEMVIPEIAIVTIDSLRAEGIESFEEWLKGEDNLYIGDQNKVDGTEKSKWRNPFRGKDGDSDYEEHVREGKLWNALGELSGKKLGAFAKNPKYHHGVILIKLFCEKFGLTPPEESDIVKKFAEDGKLEIEITVNGQHVSRAEAFAILNILAGIHKGKTPAKNNRTSRSKEDDSDDEKPKKSTRSSSRPPAKKKPVKKYESDSESEDEKPKKGGRGQSRGRSVSRK